MLLKILKNRKEDFVLDGNVLSQKIPIQLERNGYFLEAFLAWQKVDISLFSKNKMIHKLKGMFYDFNEKEKEDVSYEMTFSLLRERESEVSIRSSIREVCITRSYYYYDTGLWSFLVHVSSVNGDSHHDEKQMFARTEEAAFKLFKNVIGSDCIENDPVFIIPKAEHKLKKMLCSANYRKFLNE